MLKNNLTGLREYFLDFSSDMRGYFLFVHSRPDTASGIFHAPGFEKFFHCFFGADTLIHQISIKPVFASLLLLGILRVMIYGDINLTV